MNWKFSVMAALLVMANFYILTAPYMGRVSIAFGLFPALVWAVLSKRWIWGIIFALLINFAHYSTAYIVAMLLSICLVWLIFRGRPLSTMRAVAFPLVCLLAAILVWHFGIAKESGRYGVQFTHNAVASVTNEAILDGMRFDPVTKTPDYSSPTGFWTLDSRETVVKVAFGATWPVMDNKTRTEFIINWLVVLTTIIGAFYVLWKQKFSTVHRVLIFCGFMGCVATVMIPYLSLYYGIGRVWYYFMALSAPAVLYGVSQMSKRKRIIGTIYLACLTVTYGLFLVSIF